MTTQTLTSPFTHNHHTWCVRRLTCADIAYIVDYWHDPTQQQEHNTRGADLSKIAPRAVMTERLTNNVDEDLRTAAALPLIIECDGQPVANVTAANLQTTDDKQVHCHIWRHTQRHHGIGSAVFLRVLAVIFFYCPTIDQLVFEPSRHNVAINGLIQKFGFRPVKTYWTQPSPMTHIMDVNRYEIARAKIDQLIAATAHAS